MSFNSGIVFSSGTIGVSVYDVQRALSTNQNRFVDLCTHDNIRKWAKYKPVKCATTDVLKPITEQQRKAVNYGIVNIPTWTSFTKMCNFWFGVARTEANKPACGLLDMDAYWDYQKPTGGMYPYRIDDFDGYFIYANPPIGGLKEASQDSSQIVTLDFDMGYEGVTQGLTVTMSDLTATDLPSNYSNFYFGVVIKAGNDFYLATQGNKVGGMNIEDMTLWSMGAHARFKMGNNSGTLLTYMLNGTPFQAFPVLSLEKKDWEAYGYANTITKINGDISSSFVALQQPEDVMVSVQYIYGDITALGAYKDQNVLPISDRNKYAYYTFSFTNVDVSSAHDFGYTVLVYDANGNVVGSTGEQTCTVAAGASFPAVGSDHKLPTYSIYIAEHYDAADTLELKVRCTEPNIALKKDTSQITKILDISKD